VWSKEISHPVWLLVSVAQTKDSGYIAPGNDSSKDWLIRINAAGDIIWNRVIVNLSGNGIAVGKNVAETEGSYIVTNVYSGTDFLE